MDTAAIRRVWPDVLARVFQSRRATWTFLSQHAQVGDYDGQRLVLEIATVGLANTFRQGNHAELVRQALIDEIGLDVPVEGRPPGAASGPSGRRPTPSPAPAPAAPAPAAPAPAAPAPAAPGRARSAPGASAPGASAPGASGPGGTPGAPASGDTPGASYLPEPDDGPPPPSDPLDDERSAPADQTSTRTARQPPADRGPAPRSRTPARSAPSTAPSDPGDGDPSDDDEDVTGSGRAGREVIETVLGGTLLAEFED